MKTFKFIDLFAGIGGFHLALKEFGGECVYACEIDKACQEVYERNFGLVPANDITCLDFNELPPEVDVVCGGFPCQPFSLLGYKEGFNDKKQRGNLFFNICDILEHYIKLNKPVKIVLLENVVGLIQHDKGRTWKVIRDTLRSLGYVLNDVPLVLSPDEIGIPQKRPRVFILAIWRGILPSDYKLPAQEDLNALKRNLSVLKGYLEDNPRPEYQLPTKKLQILEMWDQLFKLAGDIIPHFLLMPKTWESTYVEPENTKKYLHNIIQRNIKWYSEHKEVCDKWLELVNFKGKKFIIPDTYLKLRLSAKNSKSIWNYQITCRANGWRLTPNNWIPTLTAQGNTLILGEYKRFITPRECANFQSFPKTFILDTYKHHCHKQLGNAVNVECVKTVFSLVKDLL